MQFGSAVDGLSATEFPGGASNPTYLLESNQGKCVLRSKPRGKLVSSARAIDRDYRVINARGKTDFSVPITLLYCDDVDVIGAEFYVMKYIEGRVTEDFTIPGVHQAERAAIYDPMNEKRKPVSLSACSINHRDEMTNKTIVLLLFSGVVASCAQESAEDSRQVQESVLSQTESVGPSEVISEEREGMAAQSGLPQPKIESDLLTCQAMNGVSVHCGYQNPEDLVSVPGGGALIVSEMGEFMLDTPGRLSMLDVGTGERQMILIDWTGADGSTWGDESCGVPDVAAFSPHGIDLITRPDGLHQLLVVNHGKREAVEFFELQQQEGRWSLVWRGCALPPGDPFINDVAALLDGGFLVTHMWNKSTPLEMVIEQFANGKKVGWVWQWHPDSGFSKLAESNQLIPNGIAVNSDNSKVFVNNYLGNKTIRIDRASGEIDGSVEVQQPDNVTVDDEGNLWIASHKHDPLGQNCDAVTAGPCLLPFDVIKVDPASMKPEVVLEQNGPPMGFGTVALKVRDRVFVGSAHGDRVASREIAN